MKLAGKGALGVWHCVEPGSEAEVERWYTNEHYHDRVVIEGFLRARNYKNMTGDGSLYFSRYDTVSVDDLSCDAYLHSLRNPSPWSQKIFPRYHSTVRGAFGVTHRWGIGIGGYLLSLRLDDGSKGICPEVKQELSDRLHTLQGLEGVVAVESWMVNADTSTIKTKEQEIRGQQDQYPSAALLIDLMDPAVAQDVLKHLPVHCEMAKKDLMKLTYQLTKKELILPRPH
ncbi:MAG: hypothetical protein Q7W55_03410 [Pseudohongiella sp.]|nr:hypothetical protein [Pseudohongiella sp.]